MHHNQSLTSVLATLRSRLLHLREENHKLRDRLQEIEIRENVQRQTIDRLTSQGQKRLTLVRKLTEKAEDYAKQHEIDVKNINEADQFRKKPQTSAGSTRCNDRIDESTEREDHRKRYRIRADCNKTEGRRCNETITFKLHQIVSANFAANIISRRNGNWNIRKTASHKILYSRSWWMASVITLKALSVQFQTVLLVTILAT